MPYTIIVLQILAAQFVLGLIAVAVTANMNHSVIHTRRFVQRSIWAATGWALLLAIVWDVTHLFLS